MKLPFVACCAILMCRASFAADAPPTAITFTLPKAGLTSAGLYRADGRLVRVLWTMKNLEAGPHTEAWDGLDETGAAAPPGDYTLRVVTNGATYTNVGAIGNSGQPPSAAAHTPANIESVAVDADGAVYTANGWDEAGADFKKWNANGQSVYDAQYQIRNGQPNGAPYSIATDDKYLYCGMGGWENDQWRNRQQIQRFNLKDGKAAPFPAGPANIMDGHIQIYEWPKKLIPEGAPDADRALMASPLRALAITSDSIYVADALGGKIRRYDKVTGEPRSEFSVPLPQALAVDAGGRLWVGHEHHKVTAFKPDGTTAGLTITGLGEVEALAFGPADHRLYAADSDAGRVLVLDDTLNLPAFRPLLGHKAVAGDRAPDRFYRLRGIAVDKQGNLVTIQTEPLGGARLARWSPQGKLQWEQFGAEFVSLGNYGVSAPDTFTSMSLHRYHLGPHAQGKWTYTGSGVDASTPRYHSDVHGVPRLLHLGRNDFTFVPTGDGVQIYRDDKGVLKLAAMVGGSDPSSTGESHSKENGQWTWHDAKGTGKPAPDEIKWFKAPGQAHYNVFGTDVDAAGNIWFASLNTHGIWTVPMGPLDARGNPTYDWAQAREVIPQDKSPFGFEPNMAQRAADGSIYAFGWSKPWPSPKDNPFWMGGSTLVRFDKAGSILWAVPLPATCVGLDTIPGGGCMVGSGKGAEIYHYTADGLLIGSMKPGEAMNKETGWMDNHASVAVNRDPRDHILDVFAEDDYVLRIGWYRVDDRNIQTLTARITH